MTEPVVDHTYSILYENDLMVAVSKPGNMPVHEGGLYVHNCLTAILEKKFGYRLFPVFRLDRETSGIVIFAKNSCDVKKLFNSIQSKEYLALVRGVVKEEMVIDEPIAETTGDYIRWKKCVRSDGKKSVTTIFPVRVIGDYTLVRVRPLTGRQHQIRVHLSHTGHPIMGDKVYGESDKLFKEYVDGGEVGLRQMLHLARVVVAELIIECEMPEDMKEQCGSH